MKFSKLPPRPAREMTLPRVARHEAGHACAAIYLLDTIIRAKIDRKKRHGFVETKSKCKRDDPFRRAIIFLAGDAVERMVYGKPRNRHSYGDMRFVMGLGFRGRSIDTLIAHADGVVRELRRPIERVAQGLLVHGELSGRQIHRLYHGKEVAMARKKKKSGKGC